jgi:hypothetical protein
MTLRIMTLIKMTLRKMKLCKTTLLIIKKCVTQHKQRLEYQPSVSIVVPLSFVLFTVILSIFLLNVIMMSVVAPKKG